MDAQRFRRRAAEVRALAETARDAETVRLLLDVARDLELEAKELEPLPIDRRAHRRVAAGGSRVRVRRVADPAVETVLVDLSAGGAAVVSELPWPVGTEVTLELGGGRHILSARVVRAAAGLTGLAFPADTETLTAAACAMRRLEA